MSIETIGFYRLNLKGMLLNLLIVLLASFIVMTAILVTIENVWGLRLLWLVYI